MVKGFSVTRLFCFHYRFWGYFLALCVFSFSFCFNKKEEKSRIVGRERPGFPHLVEVSGYSFPSGHMMASTTFALLMLYFLWSSTCSKLWKVLFTILLILYPIVIGLSRIYLGVHFTSDVLGAFCVSVSLVSFCIFLFRSLK